MKHRYNTFHPLTVIFINLVLMIIIFTSNSPLILMSILIFFLIFFQKRERIDDIKNGIKYFFPFFIITVAINMIFSSNGSTVIFSLLGKTFTFEAFLYSLILSFKLLLTIYLFMEMGGMIDSDRAVSFFSSKLPKSTLMMMVAFKLYPNMKNRVNVLRQTYSLRGVNFEAKGLRDKTRAFIPVLSVLLESSLDGAFDIGEAAYTRGFLSGERSQYDRQFFKPKDYITSFYSALLIIVYSLIGISGKLDFDIYEKSYRVKFITPEKLSISIIILFFTALIHILTKETGNGLYRH